MAPRDENQPDEDRQIDDIDSDSDEGRVHHMFSRILNLQILNLPIFFAKFKIKN